MYKTLKNVKIIPYKENIERIRRLFCILFW